VVESSTVLISSSVIKSTPVDPSSSVFASTQFILTSSVIERTIKISPVYETSPVNIANSTININPVPTNSPVVSSMKQSTQASQATNNDDQIGLILGIVVAGSAAVVMTIAAIVLTATTIYNSHVKRTQIIQNDALSIGLEYLDQTLSTHV
jgi:beta-lactamase regulating signal transducer with metallopeptidase domain